MGYVTSAGVLTTVHNAVAGHRMAFCPGGIYVMSAVTVTKVDMNLNVLWTTTLPLPQFSQMRHIAVDPSGNVIVSGYAENGGGNDPINTFKLDPNGNILWQRTFADATNRTDDVMDVLTNSSGDSFIYAWLEMHPSTQGSPTNFWDVGVIRYDANGNTVWPSSGGNFYNGALMYDSGGIDYFAGNMALDRLGNVIFGGCTEGNFSTIPINLFAVKWGPMDNSDFISQSVPTTMITGQTYYVTLTFQNAGQSTWTAADGFSLQSRNPGGNSTWGTSTVNLSPLDSVGPGSNKTFSFYAVAPTIPGHYNFQWKVVKTGIGGIGITSTNVSVTVAATSNAARYVSQVVPSSATAGSQFSVTVTMKNVGTATWTAATGFDLRPAPGFPTYGVTSVPLSGADSIAPGQSKTFTFLATAPGVAGGSTMRWQMHRNSGSFTGFFGDRTTQKTITVTP